MIFLLDILVLISTVLILIYNVFDVSFYNFEEVDIIILLSRTVAWREY